MNDRSTKIAFARQWRPHTLNEVVGQDTTVQTLKNALNQLRLHHAYLFTGTRGVGKTTIARILAKCLNCEQGISATPCEKCNHCLEIDAGNFPDLYEIDAASRTKVEDTRELLDNVQYAPTKGRFKVYLIDEVHMLSGHSFNALLKTLEEPPEHVKFLFATTDPQKLPPTILSRCLQFQLTCISEVQIAQHLQHILTQENIEFDIHATKLIARAAQGSMRDALSLLDQSIAFSNGKLTQEDTQKMLGTLDNSALFKIVDALLAKDATELMAISDDLATKGMDFTQVLSELLSFFHQLTVAQICSPPDMDATVKRMSQQITAETIQLYYQIGLYGQRDLPLNPTPQIGFEMTLLRMLAFQLAPTEASLQPDMTPAAVKSQDKPTVTLNPDITWPELLPQLKLNGPTLELARQCSLLELTQTKLSLCLQKEYESLCNKIQINKIAQALKQLYNTDIRVEVLIKENLQGTPAQLQEQSLTDQKQKAEQSIMDNGTVQKIVKTFDATIVKDSIAADHSTTTVEK